MKPPASVWLRAAAFAVLGALTGCGEGKVYPLSPDAARTALAGAAIPDIAFGKSAHSGPGQVTAEGVAWTIVRGSGEDGEPPGDGGEVMRLAAKLTPALGGVAVSVEVDPASGADPEVLARAMSQRPAALRYFRTVAREQVDSVLTHRTFSLAAVGSDMALLVASSLPDIRRQMDDAAAAHERQDQETIHRAYDAAAGRGR